jgi:hypothetical protein
MKKLIYGILLITFFSACDNPKSIRHLIRALNRSSQIEKEKPTKPKVDYLISSTETKDSTGHVIFTALYTLPKDTNMFFLNLSYNMPENLRFEERVDSCTVNAFFFKSVADTTNNEFAIQKSFEFTKSGQFYKKKRK